MFRKLNRVIHRSNLSSRFVSVFYGELERNGTLIYVNAGHQPPLLFDAEGVQELSTGGTVIGPLPEADFRRGFVRLHPGAVLVMCTDGILERRKRWARSSERTASRPWCAIAAVRPRKPSCSASSRRRWSTAKGAPGRTTPPSWWSGAWRDQQGVQGAYLLTT